MSLSRVRTAGTRPPLATVLAATTIGVYALIIIGAVTATTEAARACGTWPTCQGQWLVPFTDPARVVAWGHRVVTLAVGALLGWTVFIASGRQLPTRTHWCLIAATLVYPVQIGIGAFVATRDTAVSLGALHLGLAMLIFTALLVALVAVLETDTPPENTPSDVAESTAPDAESPPADGTPTAQSADGTPTVQSGSRLHRLYAAGRAYLSLTKPKLMWLLCLVALAAMTMAGGGSVNPSTVAATLGGGVLAVGASGTFNNVLEVEVDQRMARTADRPLPQNRISTRGAVAFGTLLTVGSVAVFVAFVNVLAAVLGLLAILFYSVVYTVVLKPHTSQNVVLGGAVGAFPALIGWAAVHESVGLPAVVLGAVIFLWTPAHFYNLALAYKEDYERGGFPMLPVVRGEAVTRKHILFYLGATLLAAAVLGALIRVGWLYALSTVVTGTVFLWAVVGLYRERTRSAAFRAFHASNVYLGSLLVAITIDTTLL